jgi:hypothetical protein
VSALREVAAAVDPALAAHAVDDPGEGELEAIVGDRGRAFVVEAIREGYLLHYGEPRCFSGMDDDLRLLAGDALFALGLERLAETGDLEAVAELSDLITRSARAEVEGRREAVPALWHASAERLSRGPGEQRTEPAGELET